jgi:hypothetical protein
MGLFWKITATFLSTQAECSSMFLLKICGL